MTGEPFTFNRACITVIDVEDDDPRPAVLLETVWGRIRDVRLGEPSLVNLFNEVAGAVLLHYGYPPGPGERVRADNRVTAAVRMARIPEPMGCRWCGADRDGHGHRFVPWPGSHEWTEPTDDQRALRIRALATELELEVSR